MATGGDFFEVLSPEQKIIYEKYLIQARDLIKPSYDDYFVWKWIKATNYDINKAINRLEEHLKFRERWGLDDILTTYEPPELVQKYLHYEILGFDGSGNIMILFKTAFTDYRGLARSIGYSDQIKSFCYVVELVQKLMRDENKKTGRNGHKMYSISDLKGQKFKHALDRLARKRSLELAAVMETHYPELLKTACIINAPSFFPAWFNFIKMFLDPVIVSKVKIFASGGWMEYIQEEVNLGIIPASIGRKLQDLKHHSGFDTVYSLIPEVPLSHYLSNNCGKLKKDPLANKVVVKERAYFTHLVYVEEKNAVLTWSFETIGYDIGFAVYYVPAGVKLMPTTSTPKVSKSFRHGVRRKSKDSHEVLVPLERIESHCFPENGEVVCKEHGNYILYFDNTYSWMRSKTLYYKVEVLSLQRIQD